MIKYKIGLAYLLMIFMAFSQVPSKVDVVKDSFDFAVQ